MTKPQLWPVFICYRRVDGSTAARRLHEILDKWQTTGPYRRVFRSPERGSVMVDLLDPVRD